MTLKVGDRVRVTTHRHGENQFGKEGTVIETGRSLVTELDILVGFNGGIVNSYATSDLELITEGPVRTVTRREVVEGRYACVDVGRVTDVPDDSPTRKVSVALYGYRSATELKAAAAVLLELAGALEEC